MLSSNVIIKYIKITQHKSLRRKFRGRLGSMIFIIGFFPISSLLLYLFINYLMGDDSLYFYNSLETRWNGNSFLSLIDSESITGLKNKAVNDFSFLSIVVFILPIYLFELVSHYKRGLKVFILLIVPVLLYVLVRGSQIDYMGLFYYVIIIAAGIASIATSSLKHFKSKWIGYFSYALLFIISIYGEYLYLEKSSYTSEQVFFNSVVEKEQNNVLLDYRKGARFLALNTPKNSVVLCDKSIMYPIVAYDEKNNYFISNASVNYEKAFYNPKKYCDYLIISNTKSPFYFLDKVASNLNSIEKKGASITSYRSKVVYFCSTFKIVKIIK